MIINPPAKVRSFFRKLLEPAAYARWAKGRLRDYFGLRQLPRLVRASFKLTVLPRILLIRNRPNWSEFVRGKTIAIVGPAPLGDDFSDAVNSHDLVIRVGLEHWPWPGTGSRTDVWVLDKGGSRQFLDSYGRGKSKITAGRVSGDPGLEQLRNSFAKWSEFETGWIMFKGGTLLRPTETLRLIFSRNFSNTQSRAIFARRPVCLRLRGLDKGSARIGMNQIPVVLFELFSLKPKWVSVFGSDYYTRPKLSYGSSSPSYFDLTENTHEFIQGMLSAHPQIHQKRIVRWVQERRGWPTGDPLFSRLTALEEEEFLELYKDW